MQVCSFSKRIELVQGAPSNLKIPMISKINFKASKVRLSFLIFHGASNDYRITARGDQLWPEVVVKSF
jgi:hypothetical protein